MLVGMVVRSGFSGKLVGSATAYILVPPVVVLKLQILPLFLVLGPSIIDRSYSLSCH